MLSACSAPEPRQEPVLPQPVVAAPAEEAQAEPETAKPARERPARSPNRRSLKPIPTRPLNVKANCNFRDETGYRGRLDLLVRDAAVERFEAEVTIPKRGVCRFSLKEFAQAERLPNVRLAKSACSVRMWEQGERTTVAFSQCAAQCSGEAFDYLWPILVETKRGRCS